MFLIQQPLMQWDDPLQNKPVQRGKVYVGLVGLDPKIVANQIPVYYYNALGNSVTLPQPIELSDSGVPTYLGQPVEPYVTDNCSIRVDDRSGNQLYYIHEYTGTIGNGNYLFKPNNLSDVPDKALARTNLGLEKVTSNTDATQGRVIVSGYFGFGGINPPGGATNANAMMAGQRLSWSGTESALVALNLPALGGSGDRLWHVETIGSDANNVCMYAQESNSSRCFTRVKTAGTWSSWYECFTTSNQANLLAKDFATSLSVNSTLTVNNKYLLLSGTNFQLEQGAGKPVGSTVTLRRGINCTPAITTTGGESIWVGTGDNRYYVTTNYPFKKSEEITLFWNGTVWEGINMSISGGGFTIDTATPAQVIPSGSTGTIATITPPPGKKAAVLMLVSSVAGSQTGITVKVDGVTLITGDLSPYTGVAGFANGFSIGPVGNISELVCRVGQVITVETAAATTRDISLSYAFGD